MNLQPRYLVVERIIVDKNTPKEVLDKAKKVFGIKSHNTLSSIELRRPIKAGNI